jgi:hypothetical protein
MSDRQISGIEAALLYSETMDRLTRQRVRVSKNYADISAALEATENGMAEFQGQICTNGEFPDDLSQAAHAADMAISSLRTVLDRYKS